MESPRAATIRNNIDTETNVVGSLTYSRTPIIPLPRPRNNNPRDRKFLEPSLSKYFPHNGVSITFAR